MAETEPPLSHHFAPRSGWLNDPLAVTWRDDRYHLFFQHVPATTSWAPHCHWGHATTPDLLTWEEKPVALRPADDEVGCWSGCVVPDTDLLLYTSVRGEDLALGRVRVARPAPGGADGSRDEDPWDSWTPGEVVAAAPEDLPAVTFRDPFVLRDGGRWRMLVGGGLAADAGREAGAGTACVFGFVSDDLVRWRPTGLVAARGNDETTPVRTGTTWECPQVVRSGDVDVLVVSVCDEDGLHFVAAAPGRFEEGRFAAAGPWQRLTFGVPYAATAFRTREGRPALLTWLRDVADPGGGWAGALGLPLSLAVAGEVVALDLLVDPGGSTTWHPGPAGLTVIDDGVAVCGVTADADSILVTPVDGGPALTLPRGAGPVLVLVDGPVLEVLHAGRYGATALRRRGAISTS